MFYYLRMYLTESHQISFRRSDRVA